MMARLFLPMALATVLAWTPGRDVRAAEVSSAEQEVTAPATPVPASPRAAPEYRVGAGDILDITVFGNEDLTRTPTIQPSGVIALPLLGDVPVAGLTVPELQRKLVTLLARDFLVNPQVEVKIKEYQSQSVSVVGEVNLPGRKPLRGRTRLIDVLVEAGGFKPGASGEIVITRNEGTFEGGGRMLKIHLGGPSPTAADQINLELPLVNGDLITASPKYYVTVEGEVNRPGRYPIDNELTVTGAVSLAGGLTRFGSNSIKVRRVDPETKETKILEVDLKTVRNGKQEDLALQANDVITVSRRLF
jgi:polysaccharide biosynthesis/export protein